MDLHFASFTGRAAFCTIASYRVMSCSALGVPACNLALLCATSVWGKCLSQKSLAKQFAYSAIIISPENKSFLTVTFSLSLLLKICHSWCWYTWLMCNFTTNSSGRYILIVVIIFIKVLIISYHFSMLRRMMSPCLAPGHL